MYKIKFWMKMFNLVWNSLYLLMFKHPFLKSMLLFLNYTNLSIFNCEITLKQNWKIFIIWVHLHNSNCWKLVLKRINPKKTKMKIFIQFCPQRQGHDHTSTCFSFWFHEFWLVPSSYLSVDDLNEPDYCIQ